MAVDKFLATRLVSPMESQYICCGLGGLKACMDRESLSCPLGFSSSPTQGGAEAKLSMREQVGETCSQDLSLRANPRAI